MNILSILVAISAHNEAIGLEEKQIIPQIPSEINGIPISVVVYDDGSIDETARIATAQGAHVITGKENLGKADAVKTMFRYALEYGFTYVITMDADAQHNPLDLPRFVDMLTSGQDVVLGERYHPASQRIRVPTDRELLNGMISAYISSVANRTFYDVLCGYRGFSRQAIERLLPKYRLPRYGFELETVVRLCMELSDLSLVTIPIDAIYTGTSELDEMYSKNCSVREERLLAHFNQLKALLEEGVIK